MFQGRTVLSFLKLSSILDCLFSEYLSANLFLLFFVFLLSQPPSSPPLPRSILYLPRSASELLMLLHDLWNIKWWIEGITSLILLPDLMHELTFLFSSTRTYLYRRLWQAHHQVINRSDLMSVPGECKCDCRLLVSEKRKVNVLTMARCTLMARSNVKMFWSTKLRMELLLHYRLRRGSGKWPSLDGRAIFYLLHHHHLLLPPRRRRIQSNCA